MSYSFGMFFKQLSSKEEVFTTATHFVKSCYQNAEKIMENEKFYIPSLRNKTMSSSVDEYWLYEVFSFKFTYWEKEKLLGLCGYSFPEESMKLFHCHVSFQNSCDQDYAFSDWSDKINIFREMKMVYVNAGSDFLLEELDGYGYKKEEIEEMLDYFRKSCLYGEIYETLHLHNWLYDNEDEYFSRFSLCAIDSIEKKHKLNRLLTKTRNSLIKEL